MKRFKTIATLVLVGIMVMCIGALAGWYLVLRSKGQALTWQGTMRGFGVTTPSGSQNGSTYDNINGSAGGGFNVGGGGNGGTDGYGAENTGNVAANGTGASDNGFAPEGEDTNGASGDGTNASSTAPGANGQIITPPKTPRLWHVTKTPVAGYGFSSTAHDVFFAERATGYIFKADAWTGEILRKTNTLLPKTYEAAFTRDGNALYRNLNETTGATQTFSGVVGTSSTPTLGMFTGTNLPNNILALSANPDTRKLLFLVQTNGKTNVISAPWLAGRAGAETQIFSTNVGSWKPFALSDGRALLMQKPHDGVNGSAFLVEDGKLNPIIRSAPGLTLAPLTNANAFVFGTSANGIVKLYAQTSTSTLELSVKTIADKCAWAPYTPATRNRRASDMIVYCAVPSAIESKKFLQEWYMGTLHTNDSWWRINLTTGATTQILARDTGGASIDVVDPEVDPTGTMLGFKNGVDGTLWVLRIAR